MGGRGTMDGQRDKCICDSSIVNRLEGLEAVNDSYIDLFLCRLHLDILSLYELVDGNVIDTFANLWLNSIKVNTIISLLTANVSPLPTSHLLQISSR